MGLSGKPLSKEATQAYRTLVWYLRNAAHSCWTLPPDGTAEERHALTTPPPPSTRVSRKAACRRSTECRQRNQGTPRQLRTDRKDPRTRSGASCRDTPARPPFPPGQHSPSPPGTHLLGRPAQVLQQAPQEVQQQRHGRTARRKEPRAGTPHASSPGWRHLSATGAGRKGSFANRETAVLSTANGGPGAGRSREARREGAV